LDFAYFTNLGRKTLQGGKDLAEEGDDADFLYRWRALETGVAFANVQAGDQDCAAESKSSDHTQDLELCVAEDASGELR